MILIKFWTIFLKLQKNQFKDVDEHFIRISIYGYIYTDLFGEDFENKDNDDYVRSNKQYNIMEYDNEATLTNKSFDIKGDPTFGINKICKLNDNFFPDLLKYGSFCKIYRCLTRCYLYSLFWS